MYGIYVLTADIGKVGLKVNVCVVTNGSDLSNGGYVEIV